MDRMHLPHHLQEMPHARRVVPSEGEDVLADEENEHIVVNPKLPKIEHGHPSILHEAIRCFGEAMRRGSDTTKTDSMRHVGIGYPRMCRLGS